MIAISKIHQEPCGVEISLTDMSWVTRYTTIIRRGKRSRKFTILLRIDSIAADPHTTVSFTCDNRSNNCNARVEVSKKFREGSTKYYKSIREITLAPGIEFVIRKDKKNNDIVVTDEDVMKIKTHSRYKSTSYSYKLVFRIHNGSNTCLPKKIL